MEVKTKPKLMRVAREKKKKKEHANEIPAGEGFLSLRPNVEGLKLRCFEESIFFNMPSVLVGCSYYCYYSTVYAKVTFTFQCCLYHELLCVLVHSDRENVDC